MTRATKVSRTAQEPASWAPLMGSWTTVSGERNANTARLRLTYCHDEDASQRGAGDDEYATAEQDHQAGFLQWFQGGFPEHGERDRQQVNICEDVEREVDPDYLAGDCGLANI